MVQHYPLKGQTLKRTEGYKSEHPADEKLTNEAPRSLKIGLQGQHSMEKNTVVLAIVTEGHLPPEGAGVSISFFFIHSEIARHSAFRLCILTKTTTESVIDIGGPLSHSFLDWSFTLNNGSVFW